MDCKYIKNLIPLYIDDEIDEKTRLEFEEHVNTCASCKHEIEAMSKALSILRSIPQVDLPSNFKEELHEKLVKAKNDGKLKNKLLFAKNTYLKAVSTIAACVLIIFVLRGMFFNGIFYKGDELNVTESANEFGMAKPASMAKGSSIDDDANAGYGEIEGSSETKNDAVSKDAVSEIEGNKSVKKDESDNELVSKSTNEQANEQANEPVEQPADSVCVKSSNSAHNTEVNNDTSTKENYRGNGVIAKSTPQESMFSMMAQSGAKNMYILSDGDIFLKNGMINVSISVHDNVIKTEKIFDIIKKYDVKNEKENEIENIVIIEFNIKGSSYMNLMHDLESAMEESNQLFEYNRPVLIDELKSKYDEYSSKLKNLDNQLSIFYEDTNDFDSPKIEKLVNDKSSIEDSIKALLEGYDFIADADVNIRCK